MEKLREEGSLDDEIERMAAEIREKREELKKLKAAKSPYGHVTVRLKPERHEALRDASFTYGIRIKDLVEQEIDRELERLEKRQGPRKQAPEGWYRPQGGKKKKNQK